MAVPHQRYLREMESVPVCNDHLVSSGFYLYVLTPMPTTTAEGGFTPQDDSTSGIIPNAVDVRPVTQLFSLSTTPILPQVQSNVP